jgi:hypothetical protein
MVDKVNGGCFLFYGYSLPVGNTKVLKSRADRDYCMRYIFIPVSAGKKYFIATAKKKPGSADDRIAEYHRFLPGNR